MSELNLISIKSKIRQVTRLSRPDEAFVTGLWEQLSQQPLPSRPIFGNSSWYRRPVWIAIAVLLVLLTALFIGFGPRNVYAFIRQFLGFEDSGLQAVQEAGLVTDLDMTAEPSLVPSELVSASTPPSSSVLSISQTLEDITLTLNWVYVDEGRLALSWTTDPLPEGLSYATPTLSFEGFTPPQMNGSIQSLRGENNQLLFVSYQVIQVDVVGDLIDFAIDLPLVNPGDPEWEPVVNFHFDLQDIPVFRGQTVALQQTYAHEINGIEIRLKSIQMTPSFTEVVVCYDFPTDDAPFWYMQHATLQIGEGPEEYYRAYQYLNEIEDDHCVRLGFATGSAVESDQMIFRVHDLVVPLTMQDVLPEERIYAANETLAERGIEIAPAPAEESEGPGGWVFVYPPEWGMTPAEDPRSLVIDALQEQVIGPWTFYIDLPGSEDFLKPDESETTDTTPDSIESQTQTGVTVTLDWVYVDALRAGIGYTIVGLQDVPDAHELRGRIDLLDAVGNTIGGSGIGSSNIEHSADQPGVLQGTFSAGFLEPLTESEIQLQWVITLDGTQENEVVAYFPIPEDTEAFPPGVYPPYLPEGLIGTYTFTFSAPVHPMMVLENISSTTINGLEILIPRAEVSPSMSKVMFCFVKPTSRDWWIDQVTIGNGEEETLWNSNMLVFDQDIGIYPESQETTAIWTTPLEIRNAEHGRCEVFNFLLGYGGLGNEMILTIPQLAISPPEVIPEAELAAAREILRTQGIEITYEIWETAGGGGGGGVAFSSLPAGMDWETAYQKYLEALGYIYTGPWVFTFTID